ncbi:hypothetical protein BO82DRAFT_100881 [Aspergillus uvarum CBS 121591]|uniref:Uncharacterized protein n=1 Tax=Aspergillus uvarum CBS 121591 TaxID=1448315 RepID=A0A319C4W6_9EURO|nr:hypothetical protein BO82DRAFT_100881 [Aspergillus uvarum CBS 121591]PYH80896.1 hypothetical protein BO82DRAFT_100881 [Aspergillus uvarum CBS 121591]
MAACCFFSFLVFRLITGQFDDLRSHHFFCWWSFIIPVDRSQIKGRHWVFALVLSSLVFGLGELGRSPRFADGVIFLLSLPILAVGR